MFVRYEPKEKSFFNFEIKTSRKIRLSESLLETVEFPPFDPGSEPLQSRGKVNVEARGQIDIAGT